MTRSFYFHFKNFPLPSEKYAFRENVNRKRCFPEKNLQFLFLSLTYCYLILMFSVISRNASHVKGRDISQKHERFLSISKQDSNAINEWRLWRPHYALHKQMIIQLSTLIYKTYNMANGIKFYFLPYQVRFFACLFKRSIFSI